MAAVCAFALMTLLQPTATLARTKPMVSSRRLPPLVPPWAAGFADGAVIQRIVDDAIAKGVSNVVIPSGNFSFHSAPFVVASASALKVGCWLWNAHITS